ncbi:Nose resistant-to-fluoxetine protein, N-terminal,Acyltransferase 3 [Cinara cedri]|uniref:Nose resistant-to-fluoxetine protein, N-terminal,Acyltransferase 3 n=1 Tax=Cinara cedri TaxID=506608 RepID=A0A5E4MSB8_9HEMI|nr:Nose resistant-to-fluoxetine protein, N-terminal,Acyltransferase 3 [Cinara cedri]
MSLKNIWITIIVVILPKYVVYSEMLINITEPKGTHNISSELVQNNFNNLIKNTPVFFNNSRQCNSKLLYGDIIANSMNNFFPFSNINQNCTKDGQQYMTDLKNRKLWAVKMYDSSSKYPRGVINSGTEFGYFDQCMSVQSEKFGIYGAYAMANFRFHLTKNCNTNSSVDTDVQAHMDQLNGDSLVTEPPEVLSWALCFPESCTNEDVKLSIERAIIPAFQAYNITVDVSVPSLLYTSKKNSSEDHVDTETLIIYTLVVFGVILALSGMLYDALPDWLKWKNGMRYFGEFLHMYSAENTMIDLRRDRKTDEFSMIDGLKTMAILTVIIGHRMTLDFATPILNLEYKDYIISNLWCSVLKTFVSVEIFFVISGFLTYLVIEKRLTSGKPLNFILLLCNRLVRILPTYVFIIVIFTFVLPKMGDGPLWKLFIFPEAECCRKNWWTNILFINNYVNTHETCMLHAWYMACDVHFFVVGIILTYLVWKWRKVGILIFSLVFAISIYIPAKCIYDHNQMAVMMFTLKNKDNIRETEHFHRIYIKSHHRITTYLIGLAAAYVYLRIKKSKFKFSAKNRIIGFIVSSLIHMACYIATGYFYLPGITYNPWFHILYFTLQRIIYSLVISYYIIVGSISNFGFISSIMGCKMFAVIGKITYIMYLVHFIVQFKSIGQIRQPQFESFWTFFWKINGDFTTTLVYSIIINFIIEGPIRKILNRIMNGLFESENCIGEKYNSYKGNIVEKENSVLEQLQGTLNG